MTKQANYNKIPVVDFSIDDDELEQGTSSWVSTTKAVCHALEEYGCFVATLSVSDEASSELLNAMFGALDELFGFPKEIKLQNTYDKPFRGYHSPNAVHEGLGIDNPTNPQQIHHFSNLFWPKGNHNFCETAFSYAKLVTRLDQMVTRMIFQHYGVGTEYCDAHIESTDYVLRLHKYKEPQTTETHNALPEHSDMNLTTIIHQNQVNGLEIRTEDGEWLGFDPSPSSFIFMTGDAFQVFYIYILKESSLCSSESSYFHRVFRT